MIKSISTFFFFMTICCFAINGFANQPTYSDSNCCVREVLGNKVYLKPTTVYVADNGIFINVGGALHAVNHLEMDNSGVYIDSTRDGISELIVGTCPHCGEVTLLGKCMNSECPAKRR